VSALQLVAGLRLVGSSRPRRMSSFVRPGPGLVLRVRGPEIARRARFGSEWAI